MRPLYRHLWIMACLICVPISVAAQEQASLGVSLAIDPCVPVVEPSVRRFFALELRSSLPAASLEQQDGASRIELSCQESLVVLRVHDAVTGKTVMRRIDIENVPKQGRDRLLALAAVELLLASWAELATVTRPGSLGVDAKASKRTRQSARAVASLRLPQQSWQDTIVALGILSWEDHGLAGGGGIRWTRDHQAWAGFSLSAGVDTARVAVPLGAVRVRSAQLTAAAHAHRRLGPIRLRVGAGVRVGMVSMLGIPADTSMTSADSSLGFTLGPMLHLDAEYPLGPLVTSFSLEPGYHVLGVGGLVNEEREVGVEGHWLFVKLGVGAHW